MTTAREGVADAMQWAWNEFCSDTGCFPDCFEWRGRKLYADFGRGNFASMVAAHLDRHVDEARTVAQIAADFPPTERILPESGETPA